MQESAASGPPQIRPSPPAADRHLPALDGIRGVAILLVMLYHFTGEQTRRSIESGSLHGLLSQVPNIGWCGVDVFFVLSGFLITGILCDAKGAQHYFRNFYMRRVLRIFPLYYGVLLVLFGFIPLVHAFSPLVRGYLPQQLWLWLYGTNFYCAMPSHPLLQVFHLQHLWSLAVEEQFYLIWPIVIFLVQPRTAVRISLVCIGSALMFRLLLLGDHASALAIWNLTPGRMDGLAVGALCALVVRADPNRRNLLNGARLVITFAALGLAVILWWRKTWSWDDPVMETVGISLISFLAGGMLLLARDPSNRSRLSWLFGCRVLVTFGFYSYGIYIFHLPLMAVVDTLFPVSSLSVHLHSLALGLSIYVVGLSLLSLSVGWLSWHLYERHFLNLKKYFVLAETGTDGVAGHVRAQQVA